MLHRNKFQYLLKFYISVPYFTHLQKCPRLVPVSGQFSWRLEHWPMSFLAAILNLSGLGLAIRRNSNFTLSSEMVLLNSILKCRLKSASILNSINKKMKVRNFVFSFLCRRHQTQRRLITITESNWKHEDKEVVATLRIDKISHELKYFMLTFGSYKILIM